ncbi:MAG TPA: ABC transporter permease [Bryobacteraceae bacterium]|jgi:predicted permease|nr:ABC transporter permease [Bryobacteraceae bacterium]
MASFGSILGEFWRRLTFLWRRRQIDRDLAEEMRFHVNMKTRAAVDAGAPAGEAHREAHLQFGGATLWREISREAWGWSAMAHLLQDLRYAARMLRHNPGFGAVAVLSLALGIGANTAIFSLIDAVLLRMLPVEKPEQLVFVENVGARGGGGAPPYPCFEQFRGEDRYFSGLAAFSGYDMRISIDGRPEQVMGQQASGNYFAVLGVKAWVGRTLSPADDSVIGKGGSDGPVAVISYRYWKRRFAQDPAAIGKVIQLNGRAVTIIGVTPPEFFGLRPGMPVDLTVPMMLAPAEMLRDKGDWWLNVVGRLKAGAAPTQARAELNGVFHAFMDEGSGGGKISGTDEMRHDWFDHIELTPAARGLNMLRRQFSKPLLVLMALVGLVLLIACANVANLLLARTAARSREFAVRLALGAGRARLMRQVLTESLLLVAIGSLLGLLFADRAGSLLAAFFATGRHGIVLDLHFDTRVLSFTAGASLLTGLLFGLAPAWRVSSTTMAPALKQQGGGAGLRSRLPLARLLVVAQVALSLVLLIGAGLFVRSLWNLRRLDAGFRPDGVLTLKVQPDETVYSEARRMALWSEILDRVNRIPGVRSASFSVLGPLSGMERGVLVAVPGFASHAQRDNALSLNHVTPGYFETMGIPLVLGRAFNAGDTANAPRVALLNETAARFYFGGRSPMGVAITFPFGKEKPPYQIVGVVKDARHNSLREEVPRLIYLPVSQAIDELHGLTLAVRTAGDPAALAPILSKEAGSAGPSILITDVNTLASRVDQSLLEERLVSTLASFFGALALLLAAIGLYGTISYSVARRTNEIGIRMALGSSGAGVVRMVLRDAIGMIVCGMAIGLPAALAGGRYVRSQLFGLRPADPLALALACLTLAAVALLAGYLPARRASRVDPMAALRCE